MASMMKLDRKKLRYVINFGIAPFFQDILKEEVASSEWFKTCFDESLNKTIQECEVYLAVRYWDNANDKVQVRFWNLRFLGHTTTHNLVTSFTDGLSGFDLSKQIHVSIDGPSVNWKSYNEITKLREESGLSKLINIGSCNFHAVPGALKSGAE